jgi:hypothetical protein
MHATLSLTVRRAAAFLITVLLVACQSGGPVPRASVATMAAVPAPTAGLARTGEPAPTEAAAPTGPPGPTDGGATASHPTNAPIPSPAQSPAPAPTTTPRVATPNPQPFAMNLFRKGDFVAQYTFEWCVGASLQMALNMSTDGSHTSRSDQRKLWELARDRSFSPFGGANPRGWTAVLNELGVGPYQLVSLPTFGEAVAVAAEAIRATRTPVGLVMWAGRHAWVMSGFESTADPRTFDDFEVTGIRVLDPLYPYVNAVWGPSAKPNSLISPETLAKQFVLRDSTRVNLGVPPGFLLVLPVPDAA